jgi:hypothetical protein
MSVLLYYISHWPPGPTEIETPAPAEVAGVEPDLSDLLCRLVHVAWCFIQYGDIAELDVVAHFKFMFCHC